MKNDTENMTIGALAAAASVGVETVRFYQGRGLMDVPPLPMRSVRRYGRAELAQLRFIRRAQRLGFSLKEIGDLLRLDSQTSCAGTQALAQERLSDVRQRLAEMAELEATLVRLVDACGGTGATDACPIMVALHADSACT